MKRLGPVIIVTGLAGGAAAYAWLRLLTPEAREGILNASRTIAESFGKLKAQAEDMVGTYADDDNLRTNQEQTRKQWASLGL